MQLQLSTRQQQMGLSATCQHRCTWVSSVARQAASGPRRRPGTTPSTSCAAPSLQRALPHRPLRRSRATIAPTCALGAVAVAVSAAVAETNFSQLVAVVLGWACLAGSCFRSVPQIIKMMRANSAEGLSLTSIVTELMCYTVNIAYNLNHVYPFNTYGDVVACWAQDAVIIGLIVKHTAIAPLLLAASTAGCVAFTAWLFSGAVSLQVLSAMQCSNLLFTVIGVKLPQIMLNIRRGNTGLLSRMTCVLNVAGNLIRVYTTLVLTHDALILATYVIMLCLNLILLQQTMTSAEFVMVPQPQPA